MQNVKFKVQSANSKVQSANFKVQNTRMKTSKPEDRMFGIMKVGIVHNSPLTVALILTLSLITATSCDKHVVEDASWHSWTPGMVYTTNGYVTSFEKAIEECNTPEAIIFS